jgi:tetratricopeptide (TPR) repeat protein
VAEFTPNSFPINPIPAAMPKRLLVFGLIALAALVLFSGCERNGSRPLAAEIDEADYRLGQRLEKQGRNQEALAAYLRLIEKRGDAAPESHLEAGILYLQQIKDPIAAIYHFRKYLERQPNAPQAPQVRGLVESAKREFARTLPANPMESQSDRLNMLDQIDRLQRENEQLKAELALARGNTVPASVNRIRMPAEQTLLPPTNQIVTPDEPADRSPLTLAPLTDDSAQGQSAAAPLQGASAKPAAAPAGAAMRSHTVVKGDTLFSLAQRYYNNRSKWRDIYDANRDQLPDQNSLRIGMVLKIP